MKLSFFVFLVKFKLFFSELQIGLEDFFDHLDARDDSVSDIVINHLILLGDGIREGLIYIFESIWFIDDEFLHVSIHLFVFVIDLV